MVAPFSAWPWENFGIFKYLLYGPIIGKAIYSQIQEGKIKDEWVLHILIIRALRGGIHYLWCSFVNMLFLNFNRRINKQGYDFNQIDKEWDWDNFIPLQALIASVGCYIFPLAIENVALWNTKGLITILMVHVGISEPLFYWSIVDWLQCYCYVCDSAAPCRYWKDTKSAHCHASDRIDAWKSLRKSRSKGVSL